MATIALILDFFFLIEAFDLRIKSDREVGSLHKRPRQILVAVFGVAAPFTFAVADFATPHTPTVRSVIADIGKSLDVSGLQHNGQRQDRPDSGYRL